jgi:carboxyl-terminal processing protease
VRRHNDPETGQAWDGPIAVLTDRLSASASEILAGCIQDYGRGLIIGDSTFGKGTVQSLLPIGDDDSKLGAMKLTIQFFYRANGVSTQNIGVTPDVSLPSLWQAGKIGERHLDNVLEVKPVPAADRKDYGFAGDELKKELQKLSESRVKASAELQKLQRRIKRVNDRIANVKTVPLNEDEYKEFRKKSEVEDEPEPAEERKTERNFDTKDATNVEVLAVVTDYLNGLKKSR